VQIVLIRLALGALVLVAIAYTRGLRLPASGLVWLRLTVAALFANAIPYTLFAVGEQHVSSSVAGVLNATTPLWTVVIAFATGYERQISAPKLAGFIVGLAGTLLIFSPWESASQIASAGGLACLGAAASYGISYVYMDRYLARRGISPLVLSASQLTAATVLLAIVLPFAGLRPIHLRWDAIAALAVLGCLGTGIAYILNYRLITDEGTTASVVTYLLPIVAVILGAAILHDHITAQIIGGMLIVLIGVALTRRTRDANADRPDLHRALPNLPTQRSRRRRTRRRARRTSAGASGLGRPRPRRARRASTRRHQPVNQLIASAPQDGMHPHASWLTGRARRRPRQLTPIQARPTGTVLLPGY
jgi:drug/metabolite transporter (DMT)-like permease